MVSKAPKIQCFLSTCRSLFLCQFLDTASGSFIGPGISSQWYVDIMRGKDKSIAYFIELFHWETWSHIGQSWNRKALSSHKHHGVLLVTLWCACPPPPLQSLGIHSPTVRALATTIVSQDSCDTAYHKQQNCIVSELRSLGVQNQDVCGLVPSEGCEGKSGPGLSPDLQVAICLGVHMAFPLHLSV